MTNILGSTKSKYKGCSFIFKKIIFHHSYTWFFAKIFVLNNWLLYSSKRYSDLKSEVLLSERRRSIKAYLCLSNLFSSLGLEQMCFITFLYKWWYDLTSFLQINIPHPLGTNVVWFYSLNAGKWHKSQRSFGAPVQTPNYKDPCFLSRHLNWQRTNYVIHSQVASTDGFIQWPVSLRGQGGLLLGMDASLLGSLPAWVPPCLLLLPVGQMGLTRLWGFKLGSKTLLNWSYAAREAHKYVLHAYCHNRSAHS